MLFYFYFARLSLEDVGIHQPWIL